MPVRIIEAFRKESIRESLPKIWYPAVPTPSEKARMRREKQRYRS
jgi:hypothetical protein